MSDSCSRDGLATVGSFLGKMILQDFPIPITELGWFGSPHILGTNKTKRSFPFRNRIDGRILGLKKDLIDCPVQSYNFDI